MNEDFWKLVCFWQSQFWGVQLGQLIVSDDSWIFRVLGWKPWKWLSEISGHVWKIWLRLPVGILTNFGNLYFFPNDWFLELQAGPE